MLEALSRVVGNGFVLTIKSLESSIPVPFRELIRAIFVLGAFSK
jgi:hypothetical protein